MALIRRALFLALAAAASTHAAGWLSAEPEPPAGLCVLASDGAAHLYLVAPGTGISSDLGRLEVEGEAAGGGPQNLTDVAYDSGTRTAYAIDFDTLYAVPLDQPTRGRRIGSFGNGGMNALAVGPDGTLYGASNGGELFRIDPATGHPTRLGDYGGSLTSSGDLAWHQGTLYATAVEGDEGDMLVRVDPANGTATKVGLLTGPDGPAQDVYGLVSRDGALFALTEAGAVLAVDPATAALTPWSETPVRFWGATAIDPPAADR